MTATAFSLAELRAAYTALHAGAFTTDPTPTPHHETAAAEVLRRFAAHLAPNGRAIIGFGAGRGYEFSEFLADVEAAGLTLGLALSTWDLRPFTADSDFLVAVCER